MYTQSLEHADVLPPGEVRMIHPSQQLLFSRVGKKDKVWHSKLVVNMVQCSSRPSVTSSSKPATSPARNLRVQPLPMLQHGYCQYGDQRCCIRAVLLTAPWADRRLCSCWDHEIDTKSLVGKVVASAPRVTLHLPKRTSFLPRTSELLNFSSQHLPTKAL